MKRTFVTCTVYRVFRYYKSSILRNNFPSTLPSLCLLNRGSPVYRLEIYYEMDEVCSQDLSGQEHTVRHQLSSYK